mgnify:CR=1 FL=1
MKIIRYAAIGLLTISLGGCYALGGQKQTAGTLLGAIGGGLAGSQFGGGNGRLIATGIGTLAGAMLGRSVGESLDRADELYLQRASYDAFETGSARGWQNPDSGNYGTVSPGYAYQSRGGDYCREYQQTVYVGGRSQEAYGTACRQPDGSWRVS